MSSLPHYIFLFLILLHQSAAAAAAKQEPAGPAFPQDSGSYNYTIATTWDNQRLPPDDEIHISFSLFPSSSSSSFFFRISAPFYNDPVGPPTTNSSTEQPFPGLWDYEVVEAFFLGSSNRGEDEYLEIEVSPTGHYLLLYLEGYRNDSGIHLPLQHPVRREVVEGGKRWLGEALIPRKYFPCNLSRFNAYAIHGSGEERVYMSLFPVEAGELPGPDFHHLPAFQGVPFEEEINMGCSNMLPIFQKMQ